LTRKYPKVKWEGVDFLDTDIERAPFSFLNYLFWKNDIDLQSDVGRQILEHELTHIRQKHTWDKLFMQIVSAMMWFNPFYWYMQRELYMIHEFLADEKAVGDQDTYSFAKMLLEAQFGKQLLTPANSFAYRPIKRRLKMLTSSSKPKYSYMRRLFFLPLLIVVTGLFAFTIKKQDWKMPKINLTDGAKNVGTDFLAYDSVSTTTINNTIETKPDSLIIVRENNQRDTIPNVSSQKLALVIGVVGGNGGATTIQIDRQPLYIVDGVEKGNNQNALSTIDPTDIASVSVLKGSPATERYGEKGKDGVVMVTTKTGQNTVLQTQDKQPLYIVDGVEKGNDRSVLSAINSADIASVSVLKDQSAAKLYGDKGKDGVILVATKAKQHVFVLEPPAKNDTKEIAVVEYKMPAVRLGLSTDQKATFPGGSESWKEFLLHNLKADVPKKNGAPAGDYSVVVSFRISKKGKISHIKAINDPGYGAAAEVVRMMKTSPDWEPAMKNGKAVAYEQKQQITFLVTEQ